MVREVVVVGDSAAKVTQELDKLGVPYEYVRGHAFALLVTVDSHSATPLLGSVIEHVWLVAFDDKWVIVHVREDEWVTGL